MFLSHRSGLYYENPKSQRIRRHCELKLHSVERVRHNSVKTADVTKLLLLDKPRGKMTSVHAVPPPTLLFNFGQYPRLEVVFYWSITGTFVGGYDPSPQNFSVSRFCVSCLCPFMLNITLFCYINDFAGADTGTSLSYW